MNCNEKGLIAEEDIKSGGEKYPSYTFPYKYKSNYQIVENEMLWYIVSTRNQQAVKVYTQMLNWYLWKQKEDEEFFEEKIMEEGNSIPTPKKRLIFVPKSQK